MLQEIKEILGRGKEEFALLLKLSAELLNFYLVGDEYLF